MDSELIGTPFDVVPYISTIQAEFSIPNGVVFLEQYWYLCFIISAVYLLLIFLGRRWMEKKKRYNLRSYLFVWNVGLAAFSIMGSIALLPNLIHALVAKGIHYSVCHAAIATKSQHALWAFLFILSKVIELGDTAFIVLRKTPLIFLHWYHHITVLLFSWYAGYHLNATGQWFTIMNLCVHSIMYSYYAAKAYGIKVSSRAALLITIIQLSQMVLGVAVTAVSYNAYTSGECDLNFNVFYSSIILYGSYAILFANFFIYRYL